MKAKIKVGELKEVLDAVSKIAEIATLEIEKDGIATKVVNDSNTIMMSVDIPSSAFEHFEPDGGQKRYLISPGDETVQLVDGQITTKSQILYEKLCELIMDMRMVQDEPAKASKPATSVVPRANIPSPQKKPVFGAMAKAPTGGLSAQDVINYSCCAILSISDDIECIRGSNDD